VSNKDLLISLQMLVMAGLNSAPPDSYQLSTVNFWWTQKEMEYILLVLELCMKNNFQVITYKISLS